MIFNRRTVLTFIVFILGFAVLIHAQEKKKLTFEQIFKNGEPKITTEIPSITGWIDDDHYIEMRKNDGDKRRRAYSVDVKTGAAERYTEKDLDQYKSIADSSIDISSPVSSNQSFVRHVYSGSNDLFLLDTKTKEFKRLTHTPSEEKNPTLSPDGNFVAFTRENNLFIIDLSTFTEHQITTDGSDVIYNGRAAWLYYEEIFGRPSRYRAFWWSPDSRTLAFYRFDESNVPVFPIYNSEGTHGFLEKTHFPAPGDPNPEVKIGIVDAGRSSLTWADFNEKLDQYFGRPYWVPGSTELFVQWMNRGQDSLIFYSVNPHNGNKRQIYIEHQDSWVD